VSCHATAQGDGVFHALWTGDGPVTSGTHYWEVEDTKGLGGVGLTTVEKFKKGYACRSFNFNAINLSDGGALLVGQYGPGEFHPGDKVGLLVEMDAAALTITYFLNGRCLGPAFRMAHPYPTDLYPVVTFKDGGSAAVIRKVEAIPLGRQREAEVEPFPEGSWKLVGGTSPVPITLSIQRTGDATFRASLHVVNHFTVPLRHEGDHWSAGPGFGTRMMGPPEEMAAEREYSKTLETTTNLEQREGNLVLTCPTGETTFAPYVPHLPIPYTENPLA